MEIVSQPSRKKYARVKVEAGVEESETDDTIFLGDFSRNQVHPSTIHFYIIYTFLVIISCACAIILYILFQRTPVSLTSSPQPAILPISPERLSPMFQTKSVHKSIEESLGWFDVPNDVWQDIKNSHYMTRRNYTNVVETYAYKWNHHLQAPLNFAWSPTISCPRGISRIGAVGDGGKFICDPMRLKSLEKCIIYSVGSNGEFSFEIEMHRLNPRCEIHTFDIDPQDDWTIPDFVSFHGWGISDLPIDGIKTLEMTVEELGHKNVGIDVFKCDCEGCEYRVGSAFWDPEIGIKQMQLEVHFGGKWRSEGSAQADFMEQLIRHGFVIFSKEPNTESFPSPGGHGMAIEFGLLKLESAYFH